MTTDQPRLRSIQVVGFLAIILIVYIHAQSLDFTIKPSRFDASPVQTMLGEKHGSWVNTFVQVWIVTLAGVGVPLFFGISGYLFFRNVQAFTAHVYLTKIRKRIFTVLVPYCLWAGLWALILLVIDHKAATMTPWDVMAVNPVAHLPVHLWFLRDLFVYALLSPLIAFLVRSSAGSLAIWMLLIQWLGDWHVHLIRTETEGLAPFYTGAWIAMRGRAPISLPAGGGWPMLWLVLSGMSAALLTLEGLRFTLYDHLTILVGIIAIWSSYERWGYRLESQITRLEPYRFFVFAGHYPLVAFMRKGMLWLWPESGLTVMVAFLVTPLLTIFVLILMAYSLDRSAPTFYGFLTGWRGSAP